MRDKIKKIANKKIQERWWGSKQEDVERELCNVVKLREYSFLNL